jgi:hypothetical protein
MASKVRKEARHGIIGTRSTAARDESLEDFLKDFSSSVAQSAVVTVKEGKGKYLAEIPAAGTELEKQLVKKAALASAPQPKAESFTKPQTDPEELKKEAWPEMDSPIFAVSEVELKKAEEQDAKDNASVYSRTASSIRTALTRTKQNGPSELPAGLLMAEAKTTRERIGRDNLNPSRAKKAWEKVRYDINSPLAIMLDNARTGAEYIEEARDTARPAERVGELVDPKDAAFMAAVEAFKSGQTGKGEGGVVLTGDVSEEHIEGIVKGVAGASVSK